MATQAGRFVQMAVFHTDTVGDAGHVHFFPTRHSPRTLTPPFMRGRGAGHAATPSVDVVEHVRLDAYPPLLPPRDGRNVSRRDVLPFCFARDVVEMSGLHGHLFHVHQRLAKALCKCRVPSNQAHDLVF